MLEQLSIDSIGTIVKNPYSDRLMIARAKATDDKHYLHAPDKKLLKEIAVGDIVKIGDETRRKPRVRFFRVEKLDKEMITPQFFSTGLTRASVPALNVNDKLEIYCDAEADVLNFDAANEIIEIRPRMLLRGRFRHSASVDPKFIQWSHRVIGSNQPKIHLNLARPEQNLCSGRHPDRLASPYKSSDRVYLCYGTREWYWNAHLLIPDEIYEGLSRFIRIS